MKKLDPFLRSLLLLLIPTLLLFLWTKGLPQNNKESLFLNNDLKVRYESFIARFGSDEQLIIQIPYSAQDTQQVLLNKVNSVRKKLALYAEVKAIGPEQTTRKNNPAEWLKFYQDHAEMDFKLATDKEIFLLVKVPVFSDEMQSKFFQDLQSMPFPIHLASMGYTNFHLNQMGISIQENLFPLLFVLTLILTFLYYRQWPITLFVFTNSLFATFIGLAIIKFCYGEANVLTTSVPLINFVTTQSLSIHMVSGLLTYRSLSSAFKSKLTPMLLMVASTIIGFFSLVTSDIIAVKQFALVSSLALLLTTLFFIAYWKILFRQTTFARKTLFPLNLLYGPRWINRPLVYTFSLLCLLFSFFAFPRLKTTVEALYFFPPNHPLVTSFKSIENAQVGTPKLDILLTKRDRKDFDDQDFLLLETIEKKLTSELLPQFPNLKMVSPLSLLKNANYAYTGIKALPGNMWAASALQTQIPAALKNGYNDKNHYRITLLLPTITTEMYGNFILKMESLLRTNSGPYQFEFNGLYYILMKSQRNLVHSLLVSLGLSVLLVCLIVCLGLRDGKRTLFFMLSNTPPLTLTIVLLYLTHTSLNISTIKTFSISFGMIFDSTIHLLYNYRRKFMDPRRFQQAVLNPIYLSSLITICSFVAFGLHSFIPIKQFGLLLAFLLILGLFFDVLFLPALENQPLGHSDAVHGS